MSGVDQRVVHMEFDNAAFEHKATNTLQTLDKLSQSLKFQGAQDGFKNIANAADHVNLSSMSSALDNISSKFSAMGAIGFSVINNLTTSALHFATTVAQKVLDPIMSGGKQRAINLDNAKFAFQGLGIDVTAAMDSALAAVKGTSFGLDEAAKAAAQFGASGIGAGADMTQALRGIAGVAAMTNTSFSEIANIFTSSAATGKITNMDLQQFATRGLNASAALAKGLGKTEAEIHAMATAGTIDFATFSKVMDDTFGAHAQEADKTFSGALGNMHAALSRLGAAFYIPQIENTRKLLNAFSPVVDGIKKAIQPVVDTFFKFETIKTDKIVAFLGALDFTKLEEPMHNFADAVGHIFTAIQAFMTPVKQAFREIFPINALSTLTKFSDLFENFTAKLVIGGKTVTEVREVFYGLFSIFDILWAVIKGVASVIGDLIQAIAPAGSGILSFAAGLGENLRMLDATLVSGGKIKDFFNNLGEVIVKPIAFLKLLAGAVVEMFKSFSASDAADSALGRVNSRVDETKTSIEKIKAIWQDLMDRFSGVIDVLDRVWNFMKKWFGELGQKLAAAFKPGDFNASVDIINVGLLGAIALMFKKFMQGGVDNVFSSGVIARVKGMLGGVTTTLKAMQTDLKADALMKIAISLAVLAASLVVLSLIDSASLTKALTAMAVAFGELVGVMALIDQLVSSNTAAVKLGIIGAALIEFSIAAAILTLAIRNLATLSWEQLEKGLIGIAGALVVMVVASKLMADGSVGMIAAGIGMTAISVGLLVMSEAVKSFASMSWGDMAKGLVGVAAGLILITAAMNFMPPSGIISGIGFVEIAFGLSLLAGAVALFGQMDWSTMGKGLLGITGALLIITAALDNMPLSTPITAAGLLILAAALVVMAEAVKLMGSLDLGTLAKGIGGITVLLLVLDAAMMSMQGALPGAVALIVVSEALTILSRVMETLGQMKVGDILQALIALAGVLAVLGIAALVMEPIIPALLGLGAAIALIGGGFALFGAGVWLVAKGLEALASSGVTGAKAFVDMMETVATAIPEVLGAIIKSFVEQGSELLKAMPLLTRLVAAVIEQLLETIIKLAPKLGKALIEVIKASLSLIREEYPDLLKTGFELLLALLKGIRDNIGEITTVVAEIVVNFLNSLRKKVPELVTAMYALWVTVITEVAGQLAENLPVLFVQVAIAIVNGFLTGLEKAAGKLFEFFIGLPAKILDIIKSELGISSPSTKFMELGVNIILGLLNGLVSGVEAVFTWFTELPGNILSMIGDVAILETKGIEFVASLLLGIVTKAVEIEAWWVGLPLAVIGWIGDLLTTLVPKGIDIVTGFLGGIIQKAIDVETWWLGLPLAILGWLGDAAFLVIRGAEVVAGLLAGVIQGAVDLETWWLSLPATILGWIGDVTGSLTSIGVDFITGLLGGAQEASMDIWHWLEGLPAWMASAIPNPLDILSNIGKLVIQGLMDGIHSMLGSLGDVLSSVGGFISDHKGPPAKDAVLLVPAGRLIMQGLHRGLMSGWDTVEKWLDKLDPVKSFDKLSTGTINKRFAMIAEQLAGIDEFQPTIRPVLDLTNVKMGAKGITDILESQSIIPKSSFDHARFILSADPDRPKVPVPPVGPPSLTFNQYNHSPEALSVHDIYKNTKSQIALAKEEMGIS